MHRHRVFCCIYFQLVFYLFAMILLLAHICNFNQISEKDRWIFYLQINGHRKLSIFHKRNSSLSVFVWAQFISLLCTTKNSLFFASLDSSTIVPALNTCSYRYRYQISYSINIGTIKILPQMMESYTHTSYFNSQRVKMKRLEKIVVVGTLNNIGIE